MAWRPSKHLVLGELDNTTLGRITGWLHFAGLDNPVRLELEGDFHRDIRGARLCLKPRTGGEETPEAREYMANFSLKQTGYAGDITAGRPPRDYVDYPYIEWYSEENGRVVIELGRDEVEVLGEPIPCEPSQPVDRADKEELFKQFLIAMAASLRGGAGQASMPEVIDALFRPGHVVMTPGVKAHVSPVEAMAGLKRHLTGDWGELGEKDKRENDRAVNRKIRLLSRYSTQDGVAFWIITEADRSVTTLLLPSEY